MILISLWRPNVFLSGEGTESIEEKGWAATLKINGLNAGLTSFHRYLQKANESPIAVNASLGTVNKSRVALNPRRECRSCTH